MKQNLGSGGQQPLQCCYLLTKWLIFRMIICSSVFALYLPHSAFGDEVAEQLLSALRQVPVPQDSTQFKTHKHHPPWTQGETSICWSFATLSFIEAELFRIKGEAPRLNVEFPLYYNLQSKAQYWLKTKGSSRFSPGDLFSGVLRVIEEEGIIPAAVYGEKHSHLDHLDHRQLYQKADHLIFEAKRSEAGTKILMTQLNSLLSQELGSPPKQFVWRERTYTPRSFLTSVVNLPWKDYRVITSFKSQPFSQWIALPVPDNWQNRDDFLNVPLPLFYEGIKQALSKGYTVAIDADVTEPSIEITNRIAFHPIPESIKDEQHYREFLFKSGSTTDDHLMHIVGHLTLNGHDWFLVKDSIDTTWRDHNSRGYLLMHSSYVKFKVLAYIVHQDGIPNLRKELDKAGLPPQLITP